MIGAREFEPKGWDLARSQGLIAVNFRQAFGDDALEAMSYIEEIVENVRDDSSYARRGGLDRLTEMLAELKSNPIVVAIRSIGFEALCGLVMRTQGYEQIELGRVVPWQQTGGRDADVFGIRGDELRIIECKACHRRKSISPSEVRKFFTETVPAVKAWLRLNNRPFGRCRAEIWTTGTKGKEAGYALHGLASPKSDDWAILRIDEIKPLLPESIRRRSLELLNSIAAAEIDGYYDEVVANVDDSEFRTNQA